MKCSDVRDLLSPYVDQVTSPEDNRRIEEHLGTCSECRRELEELRRVIAGLRSLGGEVVPPSSLLEDIHRQLLAEKTMLGGRGKVLVQPRAGGWIAASIAAVALMGGLLLSPLVPVAQIASLVEKVPGLSEQQPASPSVEKLIAEKEKELHNAQVVPGQPAGGQQAGGSSELTEKPGQVDNAGNGAVKPTGGTTQAGSVREPKVASLVAMSIVTDDINGAVEKVCQIGSEQGAEVALINSNTSGQVMSAGRVKTVTLKAHEADIDNVVQAIQGLAVSEPTTGKQDLTAKYYETMDKLDQAQQRMAELQGKSSLTDAERAELVSLKDQISGYEDALAGLDRDLKLVTIKITIKENVAP